MSKSRKDGRLDFTQGRFGQQLSQLPESTKSPEEAILVSTMLDIRLCLISALDEMIPTLTINSSDYKFCLMFQQHEPIVRLVRQHPPRIVQLVPDN
ncbi:hypothetical protein CCHR01_18825 [Colletotrichum chrysophilum]|uniref:Uncharacterized protein n=1 Tax=Colletotrichum chrysophilum TaxID=1836956 RepID=A0AAD8ZZC9_9PEZI|nr:hypothetical protein CCHR01_18825 [Colletotrichum chrysophilum]